MLCHQQQREQQYHYQFLQQQLYHQHHRLCQQQQQQQYQPQQQRHVRHRQRRLLAQLLPAAPLLVMRAGVKRARVRRRWLTWVQVRVLCTTGVLRSVSAHMRLQALLALNK